MELIPTVSCVSHVVADDQNHGIEGDVTNSDMIDHHEEELYDRSQMQDHSQEHNKFQVNMNRNEKEYFPTRSFVWSSPDEDGLNRIFKQFHSWVSGRSGLEDDDQLLRNLAHTLSEKRTHFSWRSFANATSLAELLERLTEGPKFVRHVRPSKIPILGFIFTGQGAGWAGMGKELLRFPVFCDSFDDANCYLRSIGNKYDIKRGLSRESAWKVAFFRGIVASTLVDSGGRMLAVGMGEEALRPHLEGRDPTNLTVAGDGHMIDFLSLRLGSEGVFARQLKVQVAYHSAHMRQVADEYRRLMGELSVGSALWPNSYPVMVSSVTGRPINPCSLSDADYRVRNMISPVQFVSAIEHLIDTIISKGKRITTVVGGEHNPLLNMVELGPHPAMQSATKEIVEANYVVAGRVSHYWAV
ncbi:Acyl transferase/acyl hydrolase/lysophospholipase [Penicillium concentricum]|uniref:Acyl transferase/acyl hydrolase/lysophospholipase n=1 Tax=Penicillium concentricum TaxID=293559 RepID=A0A9W9VM32_9EURO|nr:Acyl transferase/acyl hydrolase/lysophospholipase [Penicillium concentricum]KAJ5385628.1 Acyl transferase/acyl hydrolase/lysophospholipase [Penicillium concentricum]